MTAGASLDLTQVSNVGGASAEGASRINSIERIDLATDASANSLSLAARDISDMAGFNLFNDSNGWTGLGSTVQRHQLVVDGTAADILNLKGGAGLWSVSGAVINNESNTYKVYVNSVAAVQVIADQRINVSLNVAPVVFDLNRDGVLDYSQVTMDVDGDGVLDSTKWVGAQDGVLVWDKYSDGYVHDNSQYAFSQYATTRHINAAGVLQEPTDMQGLADAFDTNCDGQFNDLDEKYSEFKLWRDINQNGVSEVGEVRSLMAWGVCEIHLETDGVSRAPISGVAEAGRTTAAMSDGSQALVADASFEYSSVSYSLSNHALNDASGAKLTMLGANMNLDFSSFAAKYTNVAQVDLSGTGANTMKLSLSDVLKSGVAGGILQITGQADDSVLLNGSDWYSTGNVTTNDGHCYVLYSAANGLITAQLLLDQQLQQHLA